MKYGAISTGSQESLDSAKSIFKEGGNAFDAAIAAVFTSMTSEFALTGPGGGGALLGIKNNNSPILYDFFVDCPNIKNKKIDFKKIEVDFGDTTQSFFIGRGSVAIPGTIAGLIQAHKENGALPLKAILEPAIDLSKNGVILSSYQAYINSLVKPILLLTDDGKKLFNNENGFLKEGDLFKNSNFSDFLVQLGRYGEKFFYKGECAELINNKFSNNGYLSSEYLSNYNVKKRKPILFQIGEYNISTNPAPSYGGTLIAFLFNLLIQAKKLNKDIQLTDLIKSMELTSIARNTFCTNPANNMEINNILNPEIFNSYLSCFLNDNYSENKKLLPGFGSTTHVSVMDKKGNVVSITTTNGEGSGHFISEFGIMMNNMLGEEDLNPFGFHKWKTVRRLPSMISPIIITKNNNPEIILGSGGSNRIRSANIQVIINLLIKKMSLQDAVSKSRIHLEGNNLYYEPGINVPDYKNLSHIKHIPFENKNLFFGGVNAVSASEAVGDERRGGVGEIF